jgi:RNA polymerase sigma-70 factor (ECF subfamily)
VDGAWQAFTRRGDVAAFEQLFRALAADLAAFAGTYLPARDDAEEVVHVVFCWLWERRFSLPQPQSVPSYLFAAVRNRALNLVRDRRNEARFLQRAARAVAAEHIARASPAPDSALSAWDIEHALREALAQMPARCREVYTLVRDHGLTYAEVAATLGISPKTVEIHMSRSLAILRRRLALWLDA